MKRIFGQILVSTLIFALMATDLSAQTRIRFAKGRSSAVVSGTLAKGASKDYVINAKEGQTLRLSVSGDADSYEIVGDIGTDYSYSAERSANWSDYILNRSGDFVIRVTNTKKSGKFNLKVSVRNQ